VRLNKHSLNLRPRIHLRFLIRFVIFSHLKIVQPGNKNLSKYPVLKQLKCKIFGWNHSICGLAFQNLPYCMCLLMSTHFAKGILPVRARLTVHWLGALTSFHFTKVANLAHFCYI